MDILETNYRTQPVQDVTPLEDGRVDGSRLQFNMKTGMVWMQMVLVLVLVLVLGFCRE